MNLDLMLDHATNGKWGTMTIKIPFGNSCGMQQGSHSLVPDFVVIWSGRFRDCPLDGI